MRTVSRWDRLLLFGGLNLAAIALFVVCFTLMPILSLRPRKFAILYVYSRIALPAFSCGFLGYWNFPSLHYKKRVCNSTTSCTFGLRIAYEHPHLLLIESTFDVSATR